MIYVKSCGHDSHHPKPCDIEHKNGLSEYLLLLIKKEAWIIINNKKEKIFPNSLICFSPDTYIHYGCDEIGYNDDWIHFIYDENEENLFCKLTPFMNKVIQPRDFHRLSEYVRLLSDSFYTESNYKVEALDSFMHILLYAIYEDLEKEKDDGKLNRYYRRFADIRTQIYNNPANDWRIPELANMIELSISYFQHLYKQFFKCSCQQDIINARLLLAKLYLMKSDMSIRDIADFCGYENELHFMRQFKKFVGITPSQYRIREVRR